MEHFRCGTTKDTTGKFCQVTLYLSKLILTDKWLIGLFNSYTALPLGQQLFRVIVACCLMAPSQGLSHCCLVIDNVLCHSSRGNFTRNKSIEYVWRWQIWNYVYSHNYIPGTNELTHWGRVTHIFVSNLTIIGSDNGLLPGQCQAIIWTNAGILWIGPLGTNFR